MSILARYHFPSCDSPNSWELEQPRKLLACLRLWTLAAFYHTLNRNEKQTDGQKKQQCFHHCFFRSFIRVSFLHTTDADLPWQGKMNPQQSKKSSFLQKNLDTKKMFLEKKKKKTSWISLGQAKKQWWVMNDHHHHCFFLMWNGFFHFHFAVWGYLRFPLNNFKYF